jgi:hypothetical protein
MIHIYTRAKDYDCTSEIKVTLENNGDLSIDRVQHELGDLQTCQVGICFSMLDRSTAMNNR